jgi:hypothetical protein
MSESKKKKSLNETTLAVAAHLSVERSASNRQNRFIAKMLIN